MRAQQTTSILSFSTTVKVLPTIIMKYTKHKFPHTKELQENLKNVSVPLL